MKKIVILLALTFAGVNAMGQIAQWKIKPEYDVMNVPDGTHIIKTISKADGETCLWSFEGNKLARTKNTIHPFKDGYAVCEKDGSFKGFYTENGDSLMYTGGDFRVDPNFPYVTSGLLLVREQGTNFFRYISLKGYLSDPFVKATPFLNGYASCIKYENLEKQKDAYPCLVSTNLRAVNFSIKSGKIVPPGNIDFISSVNEEGIAVVIIKKKIYLYDASIDILTPLGPPEGFTNMRDQAHIDGLRWQHDDNRPNSMWLGAECRKNGPGIAIEFDEMMMPRGIYYENRQVKEYKRTEMATEPIESPLQIISENGKYGLAQDGTELLPPQFDGAGCFGNYAIVQLNGKYGLLEMHKDDKFSIWLNDKENRDISFLHQTVKTKIGVEFPRYIPADKISLDINPQYGCQVDVYSEDIKISKFGHSVTYECVLKIPELSSLEAPTDITYPVQVHYDGLISPVINYKVKAKYQSWFVVDILDSETSLQNGNYSFSIDVNDKMDEFRNAGDLNVDIHTNPVDSLSSNAIFISAGRYKCDVGNLHDGTNNIVIRVQEAGCPVVPFPYEIFYTKPVAAKKGKAAQKEAAKINKQTTLPKIEM